MASFTSLAVSMERTSWTPLGFTMRSTTFGSKEPICPAHVLALRWLQMALKLGCWVVRGDFLWLKPTAIPSGGTSPAPIAGFSPAVPLSRWADTGASYFRTGTSTSSAEVLTETITAFSTSACTTTFADHKYLSESPMRLLSLTECTSTSLEELDQLPERRDVSRFSTPSAARGHRGQPCQVPV